MKNKTMSKRTWIFCIAVFLLLIQPLIAPFWQPTKRLTYTSEGSHEPSDIVVDSNHDIHVVWTEFNMGDFTGDIFFGSGLNDGATWTSKRLSYSPGSSENPVVAVDSDDHLCIVWSDSGPGHNEIFCKTSTNGGTTWSSARRLSFSPGFSIYPAVAVDSNDILYAVWCDSSPGNYDLFYKTSTNGGTSWSSPKRLTYSPDLSLNPVIAVDSSDGLHIVWLESKTNGDSDIFYKRSTNGGASWSIKRLSFGKISSSPELVIDSNDQLHVMWNTQPSDYREIIYKKSTNGGVTWSGTKRLTWTPGSSYDPEMGIDRFGHLHVVWQDDTPGNAEIYARRSRNGGTTWDNIERLSWNSGYSTTPKIVSFLEEIDSGGSPIYIHKIHIIWSDSSPGNHELYYRLSSYAH